MVYFSIEVFRYDFHEFTTKLPKVVDWIDGTKKPTIKQLEAFSKKVHLPFGYLFLQKPPIEKIPIPYFRSNGNQAEKVSVNVYDTIQLMIQRQDWLREYLKDSEFDKKKSQVSGGDFYATTKKRLSVTFSHHVERAVKSGDLLYRDAYKLTSMKGDTFDKFFNNHLNS